MTNTTPSQRAQGEGLLCCPVCPQHCTLAEGQYGRCRARKREQNRIVSVNYGKITSLMLDPIEKKPLRRFYPGSMILSVGTFGCNLACPFCQNHEISMAGHADVPWREITPVQLAALAEAYRSHGNIGIAFTYNEPLVGYEFVRDTARLVHERGMKNVMVTNGFAELPVLEELLPYIDAMNIDDIQIDKDFRVHLLRKQIVEKKDLVRISRRSGIAGIQRSLRKYAFSQLSELIGNPDGRNFGKALEGCHLNEFELMMEIDKNTLSKGETQVFVMSLYWAMMQQCKCELPFIIDTPFARIDTDHRVNIVEQFFKRLPGQLFILSTNEEISSKHMSALHDQTSNMFLLDYGDDKCTHVMENQYFEV